MFGLYYPQSSSLSGKYPNLGSLSLLTTFFLNKSKKGPPIHSLRSRISFPAFRIIPHKSRASITFLDLPFTSILTCNESGLSVPL